MSATTASDPSTTPRPTARRAAILVYAGVALLVIGMALVIAGILAGPAFLPGTWIILLGILTCAAAAIVRAVDSGPARAVARTRQVRQEDA